MFKEKTTTLKNSVRSVMFIDPPAYATKLRKSDMFAGESRTCHSYGVPGIVFRMSINISSLTGLAGDVVKLMLINTRPGWD